jgi:hypothetical protein
MVATSLWMLWSEIQSSINWISAILIYLPVAMLISQGSLSRRNSKTITSWSNMGIFNDQDATQHFVSTLKHKTSTVQEIPCMLKVDFPADSRDAIIVSIKRSLIHNQHLEPWYRCIARGSTTWTAATAPSCTVRKQQQQHDGA